VRELAAVVTVVAAIACRETPSDPPPARQGAAARAPLARTDPPAQPQIEPPVDLKRPPADALRTPSELVYKTLVANPDGKRPGRNDTVVVRYTGWKQGSGEMFFTNRHQGKPMPLNLATTAAGFTEAMQLVRKGERAVLWVPPAIGYKDQPSGAGEVLVYEVEVLDVIEAPPIPPDVGAPPERAARSRSGIPYVVLRAGTGKTKAKSHDVVTFNYTAWDAHGRMFDTTEMRNQPARVAAFRQAQPLEEMLTRMTAGERVRFWVNAEHVQHGGKPQAGIPQGLLCYELELLQIEPGRAPPPPPPDVAKPPPRAQQTPRGVFYTVLRAGKGGPKPTPDDAVRLHFTGWTTDGRMFDSSVAADRPVDFHLKGVIAGWTDGIPLMSVGDRYRFWIPEELAYKGQPHRPQGMLVYDIELLEIRPAVHPDKPRPAPPVPTP
jgi:FKBP-type peptidyl-prolyl cis-trans isomerase